jgi:hypothetical protein
MVVRDEEKLTFYILSSALFAKQTKYVWSLRPPLTQLKITQVAEPHTIYTAFPLMSTIHI